MMDATRPLPNSAGYVVTDLDRVYWHLTIRGPQTLPAIRQAFNWTTWRTNKALCSLIKAGDIRKHGRRQKMTYEAVTSTEAHERASYRLLRSIA